MNKVKWQVTQRGLDMEADDRVLNEKVRFFTAECDTFGGLNFLEFIEYLVYRNGGCNAVWVNDELVWDKEDEWHDDFLLIKVGEVPSQSTKVPAFTHGSSSIWFDEEPIDK